MPDAPPAAVPVALRPAERRRQISRVLLRVLGLNLVVAAAKIAFGAATGTVSILSDGFHSLADTGSNVVALVGVRVANRPADESHPYGHRKFETLASTAILFFLLLALVEVVRNALGRLTGDARPTVTWLSFGVMISTLAVNLVVVAYESRAAKRLRSEVLLADAHHTRSDVFTSIAVIAALAGVWLGWPQLDALAALLVAVFIGLAIVEIAREASGILVDSVVVDPEEVRRVVRSVPEILGCHHIRTRGSADHAFLDLHVWLPGELRLEEAHRLSHVVKDRLLETIPAVQDVVIHIEPPPAVPPADEDQA
ncbi:MAG: cation diffusion facilitator family transporter [Vicinamibacterales bacterium]